MTININIDSCTKKELSPLPSPIEKGWGYSFVYSLIDLRNIYLVLCEIGPSSINRLLRFCVDHKIQSESGKKWTKRNILELINAWINFQFITSSKGGYKVTKNVDFTNIYGPSLAEKDKIVFKDIFFKYFKFKEFHSLFDTSKRKNIIFFFTQESRFINRFLDLNGGVLYQIQNSHSDMMRFWDVYLKWGTTLNIIEKIEPLALNIDFTDVRLKNSNMIYFISNMPKSFSVVEFIEKCLPFSYLSVIDIERELIIRYHYKIDDIKNKIVEECSSTGGSYKMQTTSSNFIKPRYHRYYPVVENTYISHLLKV